MQNDTSFARRLRLACREVRTPLATVHGFAKTLTRTVELEAPADRYVEMIEAASLQMAELLDELSLVARIEAGRYDPALREADTLELAQAAADDLGEDRVAVSGAGTAVRIDVDAAKRAVAAAAQSALRHRGFREGTVAVDGPQLPVR